MQINMTSDLTQSATIKALIYGASGAGKTSLAATAPKPLIISAESGLLSLRPENIKRIHGENVEWVNYDIPSVECKTFDKLGEIYQWLTESPDALAYETIILDSVTDIAETVLANAKKEAKDPRQAYGKLADDMLVILKSFRDLSTHNVVFLAKLDKVKDEISGAVMFGPMMPGQQLSKQLPYLFDEVLALEVGQTDTQGVAPRYLRCHKDWQWEVKDRSGALEQYEYPSLIHLFEKLRA